LPTIPQLFATMPDRYQTGRLAAPRTYYFSLGDHKYTVALTPSACVVTSGKTTEKADVVLKTTEAIFERLVLQGKNPGALEIARGLFKTNDPAALADLRRLFSFA
jgi:hypothetical protein